MKLATKSVEKPWGRDNLPTPFDGGGKKIGEIWFDPPDGIHLPLLVKYIFTSERLSVQVHPNDDEAAARGEPSGKEECWYVIDAEPGATLGVGTTRAMSAEELRAASLDGSIEQLLDWKPVKAGDYFYIAAGTVHAIGAGITLVEVQQNADITYRLYDYGRPRELHLDDGVAVSRPAPFDMVRAGNVTGETRHIASSSYFDLWLVNGSDDAARAAADRRRWIIPLNGTALVDGEAIAGGECALVGPNAAVSVSDGYRGLVAAEA